MANIVILYNNTFAIYEFKNIFQLYLMFILKI